MGGSGRGGWRRARLIFALALAVVAASAPSAQAQYPTPNLAQVVQVVDGRTVSVRLADGRTVPVRLVGVDTPSTRPVECGSASAVSYLRQLAQGRTVVLRPDPVQQGLDASGRALSYVDRTDGLDLGLAMVRGGWARTLEIDFTRYEPYAAAEERADTRKLGVWSRCNGDFHRSRADERRLKRRRSAVAFVRHYYRAISKHRFKKAWRQLGARQRRSNGSLARWRAGHRRTRSISVRSATARLAGRRAVVSVSLRSRDRDICSGRVVTQRFRGSWVLAPRRGSWVASRLRMRKTGGGRVRIHKSQCPKPKPKRPSTPSPAPPPNCQGYSPCLAPGGDVDCAGGTGNGPRYVDGPVRVNGSDPYDLDRDGDGIGCDS